MSDYHVLDLFCGLCGFSAAFEESDRWSVTTVDIEARFEPDIQADVFDLRPSDFDTEFDVVLASPPCTCFSTATRRHHFDEDWRPETDSGKKAVALAYHTLGLVKSLAPSYWYLENPVGYLARFIGEPTGIVDYCQYGVDAMKPTSLWGTHPPMEYKRCTHKNHSRDLDTEMQWEQSKRDYAERAKVPYDLSVSIRDACEAALDGTAPEQLTIGELP